jgi:hypothetical protein
MKPTRSMSGEEQDAYTGWRHVILYVRKAGVRKAIKARTHRRERAGVRRDVRRAADE